MIPDLSKSIANSVFLLKRLWTQVHLASNLSKSRFFFGKRRPSLLESWSQSRLRHYRPHSQKKFIAFF